MSILRGHPKTSLITNLPSTIDCEGPVNRALNTAALETLRLGTEDLARKIVGQSQAESVDVSGQRLLRTATGLHDR